MQHTIIQVGTFEVNCSLLVEDARVWIVDPGAEAERIISWLEAEKRTPAGVLLTHAHFDHIGGVPGLRKRFPGLPVFLGRADIAVVSHPFNQYPPDYPPVRIADIRPADEAAADLPREMTVIPTPGHTPGGVSYYFPDFDGAGEAILFAGDTLFAGSAGRTDLPGGNPAVLQASLAKLVTLPDKCKVVPGHGPATTIGTEKRTNPFLT